MAGETARAGAVGQALLAIGDQWTLLILQRAFHLRVRRFADWRDALGVSESVLSARLKELQAGGLLAPSPYRTDGRTRTEYLLTEKSLDLWPLLIALWSWERAWVPRRAALPALLHHGCGAPTDADLGCAACGAAPVTARDVATERGAATFAQVAVPRLHRRTVRPPAQDDPLSYFPETFEILGDRWATVLLAASLLGVRRFADYERELGVAPSVLAGRLRRFTDLGVLALDAADGRPRYRLTDKGLAFFGVFALLTDWAQRWYTGPPGTDLRLVHRACGRRLRPFLRCRGCGQALERTAVGFAPAGGAAPAGR
ncbi:HxlR family transcriptional regulator [Actinocorallia herbida]|uniref:HxlR family transcriptional regulator n=1 Tax=Actinocorallia herbida TaxID=58109 RepID=A0A3N1D099_9ACTN|nr:helix-turn-helix domain-containing protein [Actinocorallia herbida]ROO86468.1 HxlR family transcriptional regulator [Actinocorallia herbida]